MDNLAEKAAELAAIHGPGVLKALAVLVIGWLIARALAGIARRMLDRSKIEATLAAFASRLLYAAMITLVLITALGKLGVPTASFVAVIGAAGLAVGFALQGSLSNFAAGIMLISFRPFKVGDFVEAAGVAGTIEEIQIFATRLRTPDNKAIIVPNAAITGANITNFSAKDARRVDMVFGISYGDDLKKAKAILEELLAADDRVLDDPAPRVAVLELGDSSVNFVVRPWVKTADYWDVLFDMTEAVKLAFDERNITIPFPQHDVHMHQAG